MGNKSESCQPSSALVGMSGFRCLQGYRSLRIPLEQTARQDSGLALFFPPTVVSLPVKTRGLDLVVQKLGPVVTYASKQPCGVGAEHPSLPFVQKEPSSESKVKGTCLAISCQDPRPPDPKILVFSLAPRLLEIWPWI